MHCLVEVGLSYFYLSEKVESVLLHLPELKRKKICVFAKEYG